MEREDGAAEFYLSDAYYCGEWGGGWQKWQTHRLPLFPYEGLHGRMTCMTFSYSILKDGVVIPSRYHYRFATLDDFYRGRLSLDDFHDPAIKTENDEPVAAADAPLYQAAYERLNAPETDRFITPFFTRGDTGRSDHPIHEIHRAIDRVVERKRSEPRRPASISSRHVRFRQRPRLQASGLRKGERGRGRVHRRLGPGKLHERLGAHCTLAPRWNKGLRNQPQRALQAA